jgi:hypothetical protein
VKVLQTSINFGQSNNSEVNVVIDFLIGQVSVQLQPAISPIGIDAPLHDSIPAFAIGSPAFCYWYLNFFFPT